MWTSQLKDGCEVNIPGVFVCGLETFTDKRGKTFELFRNDWRTGHVPAMGYMGFTKPGEMRGPHEHEYQQDYFIFYEGEFLIKLWDHRVEFPLETLEELFFNASNSEPMVLIVPPNVVHGYKNIGDTISGILNFPDTLYAGRNKKLKVDEIRWENVPNSPFKF